VDARTSTLVHDRLGDVEAPSETKAIAKGAKEFKQPKEIQAAQGAVDDGGAMGLAAEKQGMPLGLLSRRPPIGTQGHAFLSFRNSFGSV
jgi:hypothetical protein